MCELCLPQPAQLQTNQYIYCVCSGGNITNRLRSLQPGSRQNPLPQYAGLSPYLPFSVLSFLLSTWLNPIYEQFFVCFSLCLYLSTRFLVALATLSLSQSFSPFVNLFLLALATLSLSLSFSPYICPYSCLISLSSLISHNFRLFSNI